MTHINKLLKRIVFIIITVFIIAVVYTVLDNLPCNYILLQTEEGNMVAGKKTIVSSLILFVPNKINGVEVDAIASGAFEWNHELLVYVPKTVKKIYGGSFANNYNLEYVYISDSVEYIGVDAFAYCYNLQYLHISNSIKVIDNMAFEHCENLKTIELPEGLIYIGDHAFLDTGIKEFLFPDSLEYLGEQTYSTVG